MTDLMLRMSGKDFGTILGLSLGLVLVGSFLGIFRLRYLCVRHWRKKHSEIVIGRVTKCEELSLFPGTPRYLLTVEYNDNSGALETEEGYVTFCVTEKHTREELDRIVEIVKSIK